MRRKQSVRVTEAGSGLGGLAPPLDDGAELEYEVVAAHLVRRF